MRKMGRPGTLSLNSLFLLDTLHPVQADYDGYNFEEDAYDYVGYDNEGEPEYDYEEEADADVGGHTAETVAGPYVD